MTLIQRFTLWLSTRAVERRMQYVPPPKKADDPHTECARLALELADEAAQCEIECNTFVEKLGHRTRYDTSRSDAGSDPVYAAGIQRALRYLELRRRVVRHPQQAHLVRFGR